MKLVDLCELSNNNNRIFKILLCGYTKKISKRKLMDLFLNNYATSYVGIRCFNLLLDKDIFSADIDKISTFLLNELKNGIRYEVAKKVTGYFNDILPACSKFVYNSVIKFLLNSKRKCLRICGYKNCIEHLIENIDLLKVMEEHFSECQPLLHNIIYNFSVKYLEKNFDKILELSKGHRYLISKLYMRKPIIGNQDWKKLRIVDPVSYMYVSCLKKHTVQDDDLFNICDEHSKNYQNSIERRRLMNFKVNLEMDFEMDLLLWCLAGMEKWKVVAKVIRDVAIFM